VGKTLPEKEVLKTAPQNPGAEKKKHVFGRRETVSHRKMGEKRDDS